MSREYLGLNKINANTFFGELRNFVEPKIAAENIAEFLTGKMLRTTFSLRFSNLLLPTSSGISTL